MVGFGTADGESDGSFGVWCLLQNLFFSNFASGEAAMLLSLSVFVGIIAHLGVFSALTVWEPLQIPFPPDS